MHGVWGSVDRPNTIRQKDGRVTKSERIRLLEMEVVRLQFQIDYVSRAIEILLAENKLAGPEMDAGKWYKTKLDKDK